jgi:hypothetical protein
MSSVNPSLPLVDLANRQEPRLVAGSECPFASLLSLSLGILR